MNYMNYMNYKLFPYVRAYFCLPIGGGRGGSESSIRWKDSNTWRILGGNEGGGETKKAKDIMTSGSAGSIVIFLNKSKFFKISKFFLLMVTKMVLGWNRLIANVKESLS